MRLSGSGNCLFLTAMLALLALATVLFLLGISGCCPVREVSSVTVHDTTYAVQPDPVDETLPLRDSYGGFEAWRTEGKDTVTLVRVDTVTRIARVYVKPDSVIIIDHDTTTVTRFEKVVEETPFLSKVGLVAMGVGAGMLGMAALAAYLWFKKKVSLNVLS